MKKNAKSKRTRLLLGAALIGSIAASGIVAQQTMRPYTYPTIVQMYKYEHYLYSGPLGASQAEQDAVVASHLNGNALPAGWTKDFKGKIRVTANTTTGSGGCGSGSVETTFRAWDDSADMDTAYLYIDGVLIDTATRGNGGIVDIASTGQAKATFVTCTSTDPWGTAEIKWVDAGGTWAQLLYSTF